MTSQRTQKPEKRAYVTGAEQSGSGADGEGDSRTGSRRPWDVWVFL